MKINHCTIQEEHSFIVNLENDVDFTAEIYEIYCENKEHTITYVNALNYFSQLIKSKVFSFKNDK